MLAISIMLSWCANNEDSCYLATPDILYICNGGLLKNKNILEIYSVEREKKIQFIYGNCTQT